MPAAAHSKPSNRMLDAATVPVAAWRCLLRQETNACMPRWRVNGPRRSFGGRTTHRSTRRHGVHADASVPRCQLRRAEESAGELAAWRARGTARMRPGHNRGRLPDGQGEPPDNPHVAQRTEQPPPKRQDAGSSPAVGAISCDRRPFFAGSPQKTAFYSQKDESKRNGATAPVAARACRSRPMGPSSPERTRYPPSRRQRRGFAAGEKPLNPPRVQGLNDQRRPAMTLSERLDRALAWLLFDFDPTPWAERHPWLAVGALLLALAVVGHWDVM